MSNYVKRNYGSLTCIINGNEFYFNELKSDHPAIKFARSINPNFDEVLKNISY
jgi:hypothetical protein